MPGDQDSRPIPDNDVIGVIMGVDSCRSAVEELKAEGIPEEDIRVVWSGRAEEELENPGRGGIIGRIAHGALSEESIYLDEYKKATESGGQVLAVHVEDKDKAQHVTEILSANHATNIKFFGKFAITEMTLPGDENETQG